MSRAILLHPGDDVAVLVAAVAAGAPIDLVGGAAPATLRAAAALPLGHKVAVHALAAGSPVRKYGEVIGRTTAPVAAGEHVHVHNLVSLRGEPPRNGPA